MGTIKASGDSVSLTPEHMAVLRKLPRFVQLQKINVTCKTTGLGVLTGYKQLDSARLRTDGICEDKQLDSTHKHKQNGNILEIVSNCKNTYASTTA